MGTVLLCSLQEKFGMVPLAGMSCVVDGTIPPSSGLSSSSALVCCAGLVTMEANQKSFSKVEGLKRKKKRKTCLFNSLFEWKCLSPLRCDCCSDGAGRNMCKEWTLHRDRGRRYGPVHLIPGRERNGAKVFLAIYSKLFICWSQYGGFVKSQQNFSKNIIKKKTTQKTHKAF